MHHELLAPRPVRAATLTHVFPPARKHIASPPLDAFARITLADDGAPDAPDDVARPPPPSPRFNAEALEEFLSILRPSLLSPTSPIARFRRPVARPHPYRCRNKSRGSASASHSSSPADESDPKPDAPGDLDVWQASVLLASPISREAARNPLPRDPQYETLSHTLHFEPSRSPSPPPPPRSGAESPAEEMETTS